MPREQWTDGPLDDLNQKVDDGFARVEAELRLQRGEVAALRNDINARFEAIEGRFAGLNRTLIASAFALAASVIAAQAIPF